MGDFGMFSSKEIDQALQERERRDIYKKSDEDIKQDYQGKVLQQGESYDMRNLQGAMKERQFGLADFVVDYKAKVRCQEDAWRKIRENAGMVKLIAPTGVAIGSPVQKEPAEDDKTRKDREKKLAKIKKKGYGKASHESVVLQEKVSQSLAFRNERAKQRSKEEKKIEKQIKDKAKLDKEKELLDKEDAKQNLIRAFSHNIRTDRSGKPIIRKGKDGKPDEDDENFKALKSNEAFKNNFEGHMAGVVQWVYQVDLNPEHLKDAYVKAHGSELFQTAERLKAFFDYYKLMGKEEWEKGFLNDGAIVGERGKEILDIKAKQAQNFLDVLSSQFKTALSVDTDKGKFLTDDENQAIAGNEEMVVVGKRTELNRQRVKEAQRYQWMVENDLKKASDNRDLAEGNQELKKVFEEHKENAKRYIKLSATLRSGYEELKKYRGLTESIRAQIERDKESFNKVYEDLEKYLQLNYANQTVLGEKLQGIVDQKRTNLQEERRQLNERLKSCEEPIRFIVEGGKIASKSTVDTLVKAGYPVDDLLHRAYHSKGGIVDQSNEILKELDQQQESEQQRDERLLKQSFIVRQGKRMDELTTQEREQALQEVRSRIESRAITIEEMQELDQQQESEQQRDERLLKQSSVVKRGKKIEELTDEERKQALEEVRATMNGQAVKLLFGRGDVGAEIGRLAAKSVDFDFKERYAKRMESFVRQTVHVDQYYKLSTLKNDGTSFDIIYGNGGRGKELKKTGKSQGRFTYHPVNVDNVLELKEKGNLEQDSDGNFVGAGMDQATLDYVNYVDILGLYDTEGSGGNNSVMRYFDRMKELIGDAKFFQVKDEKGEVDEKKTNRKFTAFLLQDYSNHNTACVPLAVQKTEGQYTKNQEKQVTIFTMIASSLMDIAKKDTTGGNYKEGSTMQEALVTYRKTADRVARELEKREAEKKEKKARSV